MTIPQVNRYILCQYVPMPNGKANKIPLHPTTLKAHSPLKPEIHMSYEAASELAQALGESYGIGFVFLKEDNYFLIDLDNCLQADGTWSETAYNTLTYYPNAYVEVSHSGKGLHIIGKYEGDSPFDGRRLDALGIEIYTNGRFCALTQLCAQGDAQSDQTASLAQYVKALGLDKQDTEKPNEWTTEAAEGTNPPADNDELLKFILSRRLTKDEVFRGVLPLRDLWENNVDVLAKHYPTQTPGKPYDASAADAALAYRLHYFTGGNCERVLELMQLSKLKRDKWEYSPNYLPRTILNARGVKPSFFAFDHLPQMSRKDDNTLETGSQQQIGTILNIEQQVAYFQNCTYVAEVHAILTPEGILYKPDAFNSIYGGVSFQLDHMNEKITRKAFEAFTLSQGYQFPKVHGTCFNPRLDFSEIVNEYDLRYVNTYRPVNPPRIAASIERFERHIKNLLPNEEDRLILLSYLAALIQYKGIKFTWCVIIQGVEGNGKSFLNEVLAYCIGHQYVHSPKSSELTGRFNGWMENKLLITVDDIYQSSWDMLEILKPMITNKRQEIERKGVDKVTREVFCNFILNTNHQDGIRKTRNDRRFAPLFTAQQELEHIERDGMGGNYFPELFKWFNEGGNAAIHEYLATFQIPDRYNPTTNCIRAPITSSTELAIKESLDPIAQRISEWIGEGGQGFRKGWLSSTMINRKLLEHNIKTSPKHLNIVIKNLGYIPHPALHNGRSSKINLIDNARPILYVESNHTETLNYSPLQISDKYEGDQK